MIILVGASASGKTEIAKSLIKNHKMKKLVTYTTRDKRVGEIDDVDYHFLKKDLFLEKLNNKFFLETTLYNNNYYGTALEDLSIDKVVILDPNGLTSYSNLKDKTIVSFFIDVNEKTRESRMISRGDNLETIKERLSLDKTKFDIKKSGEIDFIIKPNKESPDEIADYIYSLYLKVIK